MEGIMHTVKEGEINGKLLPWPVVHNWYVKEEMTEASTCWPLIDSMIDSVKENGEITKEQYRVFRRNGRFIRLKNILEAERNIARLKEQLQLAKLELKEIKETERSPECCMCHNPLMEHSYRQFVICMSSEVIRVKE
jgi:hypothetical protein